MTRVGHLLPRHRPDPGRDADAGSVPGAVGDQREGAAARHGAPLVGEGAAQADGGLQFRTGPVEVSVADREDAQLVVEVGLFTHVSGEPGGLRTGPERPLPGAPVQPGGEGGRGGPGEQDGRALLVLGRRRGTRHQHGERGEQGVRLRAHPLRGDRGVRGPPGVVPGGGQGAVRDALAVSGGQQLGAHPGGEAVGGADR